MFCGKCGAQYDEGALFCPKCGNSLQKNANMPVKEVENTLVKQKKGGKKWLVAVIIIFLILGGTGFTLWQSDILSVGSGRSSKDITRGYDASTTAAEVMEQEEEKKDTTLLGGSVETEVWNDVKGIFEYKITETNDPEELRNLAYEGGKFLGVKAEITRFDFYTNERELSHIVYVFLLSDYDKVMDKISKEFGDYKIENEFGEYWSMGDYTVRIKDCDEEKFSISVSFVE